jgi:hypothetical protein
LKKIIFFCKVLNYESTEFPDTDPNHANKSRSDHIRILNSEHCLYEVISKQVPNVPWRIKASFSTGKYNSSASLVFPHKLGPRSQAIIEHRKLNILKWKRTLSPECSTSCPRILPATTFSWKRWRNMLRVKSINRFLCHKHV